MCESSFSSVSRFLGVLFFIYRRYRDVSHPLGQSSESLLEGLEVGLVVAGLK